jgi:hypothetical protein
MSRGKGKVFGLGSSEDVESSDAAGGSGQLLPSSRWIQCLFIGLDPDLGVAQK